MELALVDPFDAQSLARTSPDGKASRRERCIVGERDRLGGDHGVTPLVDRDEFRGQLVAVAEPVAENGIDPQEDDSASAPHCHVSSPS